MLCYQCFSSHKCHCSKWIVSLSQRIRKFFHIYLILDIIMIAMHSLTILWPFLKWKIPPPWIQSQRLHPPKVLTVHMPLFGCFDLLVLFLLIFRNIPLHLMPIFCSKEAPSMPNWWCWATLAPSLIGFHVSHSCQHLLLGVALSEPALELPDQPSHRQGTGRSAKRPMGRQPGVAAPTVHLHSSVAPCWLPLCMGHIQRCPVLAVVPTGLPSDTAGKVLGCLLCSAGGSVKRVLVGWVG